MASNRVLLAGESHEGDDHVSKPSWWRSLPWIPDRADWDAFMSLTSNNMATLMSLVAFLTSLNYPADIVYGKIVPSIGLALLIGNFFYVFQALLYAHKTGRSDVCAQPFGINTPGAFAFISSIMIPVYHRNVASLGEKGALNFAWEVSVVANFIQGVTEVILALVGPLIMKFVPMVALLTCLSSIGLSYLYTNTFQSEAASPITSWVCFFIVIMGYFGGVRFGKVPTSVVCMGLGMVLAWSDGTMVPSAVHDSLSTIGFRYPVFFISDHLRQSLSDVTSFLGLIIPVGLTVAMGTIQCCKLAHNVGDQYNVRWSMVGDGLMTVLSSLFGSPFGMTVFIGHPAYKLMGAKIAYCWLTGLFSIIICCTGLAGLVLTIIPIQSLNPIIMFVGVVVCCDTLAVTPARHFPAFIIGLAPCMCAWAMLNAQSVVYSVAPTVAVDFTGPAAWIGDANLGLYYLGSNYLITSIVLCSMTLYVIDRRFIPAAVWSLIGAVLSLVGFMHAFSLGFYVHRNDLQWRFTVGYAACAALFVALHYLQKLGYIDAKVPKDHDQMEDLQTTVKLAMKDLDDQEYRELEQDPEVGESHRRSERCARGRLSGFEQELGSTTGSTPLSAALAPENK